MRTILASGLRTASSATAALDLPEFARADSAIFMLNVTTGGAVAGDLLDVFVQSSVDVGSTWNDLCRFTQVLGSLPVKKYLAHWVRSAAPTTSQGAPTDATMAAGVIQGPHGPDVRVKWLITDGGAHGQTFTFSVGMQATG